jgi:Ca2+-binding RTX toxin-like protein
MADIKNRDGNDILTGTASADFFSRFDLIFEHGKNDNDTIRAGAGDDVILAGAGNDHYDGGRGFDTLVLSTGPDDTSYTSSSGTTSFRNQSTTTTRHPPQRLICFPAHTR